MGVVAAAAVGGLLAAGGSIGGSLLASKGANKQSDAMMAQIAETRRQYDESAKRLTPYYNFGKEQLNSLGTWLNDPTKQPMSFLDPGYEFRRQAGLNALTGNAASAGMLKSGDTLRALENYGQDLASQEYGNAFNRWLAEGQFKQNLAGMGQNAAVNQGAITGQGLQVAGNLTQNAGLDQASKILGEGVAGAGGAIGNAFSRYLGSVGGPQAGPPATTGGSNIFAMNANPNMQATRLGLDYSYKPATFGGY